MSGIVKVLEELIEAKKSLGCENIRTADLTRILDELQQLREMNAEMLKMLKRARDGFVEDNQSYWESIAWDLGEIIAKAEKLK